jgi:hypothetical protein
LGLVRLRFDCVPLPALCAGFGGDGLHAPLGERNKTDGKAALSSKPAIERMGTSFFLLEYKKAQFGVTETGPFSVAQG